MKKPPQRLLNEILDQSDRLGEIQRPRAWAKNRGLCRAFDYLVRQGILVKIPGQRLTDLYKRNK